MTKKLYNNNSVVTKYQRFMHPEFKVYTSGVNSTIGSAFASFNLSFMYNIRVGTGNTNRIGNRICVKSMLIDVTIVNNILSADPYQPVRVILIRDKSNKLSTGGINADDLFDFTGLSLQYTQAWYKLTVNKRYDLLKDTGPQFVSALDEPPFVYHVRWRVPMNHVTIYKSDIGNDDDITTNNYFVIAWQSVTDVVNLPEIFLSYRVRFVDC